MDAHDLGACCHDRSKWGHPAIIFQIARMKLSIPIPFLFLILLAALPPAVAAAEPEVIYWNSDAGKALRARIAPDEDYWQLIP